MKKVIIVLLACIGSFEVGADGIAQTYNVVSVRVDAWSGYGFVKFDQDLVGTPASCISNHSAHLAFDVNTSGGKGVMSLALAAKAAGKRIYAEGTGSCDQYIQVESWRSGWIID